MAFITVSAIISDIKGKLNGSYFQSQKGGITVNNINSRNKSSKSSNSQVNKTKGAISVVSKTWRTLSPTDQATWDAAASTETRTNKNGTQYVPTGYQLFNEQNLNFVNAGDPPISTYNGTVENPDMTQVNVVGDGSTGWDYVNSDPTFADTTFVVYATAPQSKGVKYPRSSYRKIGGFVGTVASFNLNAPYAFNFGTPSAGQTAFFKIKAVNNTSGKNDGSKLTKADAG